MILQRLKESLYFWRRHLAALFVISAPFALIGEAFQWLVGPVIVNDAGGQVVGFNAASMLFLMMLRPLAEGALIFQLSIIQRGDGQGPWHSILAAFLRFPYLLATYFLMALAVSVGWMLLFFPAFWIYARLCFAPFRVMLRGDTPLNALRTSFTLSGPCQWHLLAAILLAGTLVFAVAGVTNSLLVGMIGDHPGALLVASLVVSLTATLVNVVAFRFWTLHDQE